VLAVFAIGVACEIGARCASAATACACNESSIIAWLVVVIKEGWLNADSGITGESIVGST
jgi:hypothetical protein